MKKTVIIFTLFCIKSYVYGSSNQPLLHQASHSRCNSIQSINTPRSTNESNTPKTTAHTITIEEKRPQNSGYNSINIPENDTLNREDHEWIENKTTQCKLCGILSIGLGVMYVLISSIPK